MSIITPKYTALLHFDCRCSLVHLQLAANVLQSRMSHFFGYKINKQGSCTTQYSVTLEPRNLNQTNFPNFIVLNVYNNKCKIFIRKTKFFNKNWNQICLSANLAQILPEIQIVTYIM